MIGGRRWWLAWPAGILCAGIVAGLVYLAFPAVPGVVTYTIELLQQGAHSTAASKPTAKPVGEIGTALTDDCVSLYPSALWIELTLDPHTVLSQDMTPPASELMTAMAPWHPAPRMTCGWRAADGGTVRTSLVDLSDAAAAQARIATALGDLGFACSTSPTQAAVLTCTRTRAAVTDTEVIAGRYWLSTAEAGWQPGGYVNGLVDRLWPHPKR